MVIDFNCGEYVWMMFNGVGLKLYFVFKDFDLLFFLGNGVGVLLFMKILFFVIQCMGFGLENFLCINVFDKVSGELIGYVLLFDVVYSNLIIYQVGGKQYFVVVVGGGVFLVGFEVFFEFEEMEFELVVMLKVVNVYKMMLQFVVFVLF